MPVDFMKFIDDREEAIRYILDHLSDSDRIHDGLGIIVENLEKNKSDENTRKMLITLAKITRNHERLLKNILVLCLVYISGDSFYVDASKAAIKVGSDPKEVLRKMFRDKMSGKF